MAAGILSSPVKLAFAACIGLLLTLGQAGAAPLTFVDDAGRQIRLEAPPRRVVSLVPSVTEILFAIGAGDAVRAVTYHDHWPPEAATRPVVGGFAAPDPMRVMEAAPQAVFVSSMHQDLAALLSSGHIQPIRIEIESIEDSFAAIRRLGQIFDRGTAAEALVARIRTDLDLVAAKVAKIPAAKRLRVMRLMGRDRVMAPGDDSFQNQMIRVAGGIAPQWGQTGDVVEVTMEQWQRFNPQVVYGCGGDRQAAARLFDRPGWRDVEAVKNGRLLFFPCELTCRCATHSADFVAQLASRLYSEAFARQEDQIHPDAVFNARPLALDLPYVARSRIVESRIHDFVNKTLAVDFSQPMQVVSSLEGQRGNILTVGNHYAPPACWAIGHQGGLEAVRRQVYGVLGQDPATASFLFTGADMDHLSVQKRICRQMAVVALVTAGVESNAQRTGCDAGFWYEPGTINIILLTNMRLSPRAMTRALITATEAKTAALQDLDIRSSVAPYRGATGTGTDNIIVVQGTGVNIDNAGGHSKMGELIAAAVHAGVKEAVFKQNGLAADRSVFRRIEERGPGIWERIFQAPCNCAAYRHDLYAEIERLLLQDRYAGFLEAAMALDDARACGRKVDLSLFARWCQQVSAEIGAVPLPEVDEKAGSDKNASALDLALDALRTGVAQKMPAPVEVEAP